MAVRSPQPSPGGGERVPVAPLGQPQRQQGLTGLCRCRGRLWGTGSAALGWEGAWPSAGYPQVAASAAQLPLCSLRLLVRAAPGSFVWGQSLEKRSTALGSVGWSLPWLLWERTPSGALLSVTCILQSLQKRSAFCSPVTEAISSVLPSQLISRSLFFHTIASRPALP